MAPRADRPNTHRVGPRLRQGSASAFAILALVVAAGLLSACVGDVPEVSSDDPVLVQGREVYSRNCVGCHGASGQGGTGTKLSDGAVNAKYPDAADQFAVIANGNNQMPAFSGKLSDEEIDAVVQFTREGL